MVSRPPTAGSRLAAATGTATGTGWPVAAFPGQLPCSSVSLLRSRVASMVRSGLPPVRAASVAAAVEAQGSPKVSETVLERTSTGSPPKAWAA